MWFPQAPNIPKGDKHRLTLTLLPLRPPLEGELSFVWLWGFFERSKAADCLVASLLLIISSCLFPLPFVTPFNTPPCCLAASIFPCAPTVRLVLWEEFTFGVYGVWCCCPFTKIGSAFWPFPSDVVTKLLPWFPSLDYPTTRLLWKIKSF